MSLSRMASISERENREIEAANTSGHPPVVFIHGLWLLPGSWASWADFFNQAGYAPLTPDWPDDPETVEQARANPDVLPHDRPWLARGRPDGARLRRAVRVPGLRTSTLRRHRASYRPRISAMKLALAHMT